MDTYTYKITGVKLTSTEVYSNIVTNVSMITEAQRGSQGWAIAHRDVVLNPPDGTFVDYGSVTAEDLVEWAKESLGSAGMQALHDELSHKIDTQIENAAPWWPGDVETFDEIPDPQNSAITHNWQTS